MSIFFQIILQGNVAIITAHFQRFGHYTVLIHLRRSRFRKILPVEKITSSYFDLILKKIENRRKYWLYLFCE